jgi:two-component system response regulator ResD
MEKERILIVDDEYEMRRLIKIYLSDEYTIVEAEDGIEALEKFNSSDINLIVLDVMMPDMDGWEVCSQIRKTDALTPILMLTARSEIHEKVRGLKIGADDYLTKPFDPNELVARIQALLRRSTVNHQPDNHDIISFSNLVISVESRSVKVNNKEIILTPKEFDLLLILASNYKRVYTREILLEQIWKYDDILDVRTVDTHIKNIREKVKKAGLPFNPIKTIWGVGYKFIDKEDNK